MAAICDHAHAIDTVTQSTASCLPLSSRRLKNKSHHEVPLRNRPYRCHRFGVCTRHLWRSMYVELVCIHIGLKSSIYRVMGAADGASRKINPTCLTGMALPVSGSERMGSIQCTINRLFTSIPPFVSHSLPVSLMNYSLVSR
jgi:hypothetical protein